MSHEIYNFKNPMLLKMIWDRRKDFVHSQIPAQSFYSKKACFGPSNQPSKWLTSDGSLSDFLNYFSGFQRRQGVLLVHMDVIQRDLFGRRVSGLCGGAAPVPPWEPCGRARSRPPPGPGKDSTARRPSAPGEQRITQSTGLEKTSEVI